MRLLVVSDGRRGIENQALGLAEAIARLTSSSLSIATHIVSHSSALAAMPPSLQLTIKRDFGLPEADLVIGCGRQAIAPLISLRRQGRPSFTVFVQDPRTEPSRFDLVIAPAHDGLSGPFVETMIGSPNRITRNQIITGTLNAADRLKTLPMPRAMLAIGGPSQRHTLSSEAAEKHIAIAEDLRSRGYGLLITTSRRTPDPVAERWEQFAQGQADIWLHSADSKDENPYFAFLGGADILLITEDSTNMLTEGCATGKPVYRLPMEGRPGKFDFLYKALEERCGVRLWNGSLDITPYEPLDETSRIAQIVLDRMG